MHYKVSRIPITGNGVNNTLKSGLKIGNKNLKTKSRKLTHIVQGKAISI